jgi:hypothetical protein
LIRIIGDRFNWEVKAAILQTLILLINKGGVMLKPFIPQLQTTFTKALNDPTRVVQSYAATALSALIVISTKVDPIITELLSSINQSEGPAQESMLSALQV